MNTMTLQNIALLNKELKGIGTKIGDVLSITKGKDYLKVEFMKPDGRYTTRVIDLINSFNDLELNKRYILAVNPANVYLIDGGL